MKWYFGFVVIWLLGLVNSILSAPFWTPLSRLTYCAYLIHLILLSVRTGSLESLANTYSDIHVVSNFWFFWESILSLMTSKQTRDKQNTLTGNGRNKETRKRRDEDWTKQTIFHPTKTASQFSVGKKTTIINLSSTSWAFCSDTKFHQGMFLNLDELVDI